MLRKKAHLHIVMYVAIIFEIKRGIHPTLVTTLLFQRRGFGGTFSFLMETAVAPERTQSEKKFSGTRNAKL